MTITQARPEQVSVKKEPLLVLMVVAGMSIALLILAAILPLAGLWFHTALLTDLSNWFLLPTRLLFPGWQLSPSLNHSEHPPQVPLPLSWLETLLLLLAFALVWLCYLWVLYTLPQRVTRFFIYSSTLFLGILYVLFPVLTSQDIFSYIIYARMAILYHLNPFNSIPLQIPHDAAYLHLYWKDQPSAYGPVWTLITCTLQWLSGWFGTDTLVPMVLALRLTGLFAHLSSTLLIWSLAGWLQGESQLSTSSRRVQATLAFAWNPLLLFEACTNAHNDSFMLLGILAALYFLIRLPDTPIRATLLATFLLALATCIKVNVLLFLPGLLLFLWLQSRRWSLLFLSLATYLGTCFVLYLPFWSHGTLLGVLQINPSTYRNTNTLMDFLSHSYNSIAQLFGAPPAPEVGSVSEKLLHTGSLLIFVCIYLGSLWQILKASYIFKTPIALIRWMTFAWLLYCTLGSPWFWPWYLTTFFGLFALVESLEPDKSVGSWFAIHRLALSFLTFTAVSVYCFYSWGFYSTFLLWPPNFRLAYLRGLWIWLPPQLVLLVGFIAKKKSHTLPRILPEEQEE